LQISLDFIGKTDIDIYDIQLYPKGERQSEGSFMTKVILSVIQNNMTTFSKGQKLMQSLSFLPTTKRFNDGQQAG
jgi:hypothetical protein